MDLRCQCEDFHPFIQQLLLTAFDVLNWSQSACWTRKCLDVVGASLLAQEQIRRNILQGIVEFSFAGDERRVRLVNHEGGMEIEASSGAASAGPPFFLCVCSVRCFPGQQYDAPVKCISLGGSFCSANACRSECTRFLKSSPPVYTHECAPGE